MKKKLSIVIPIYNEEKNIKETLLSIKQNITIPHEIIVVYDFDNDATLPILYHLQNKYNNLFIIKNNVAIGPSGALRTGIARACGSRILITMADLCDDLTQVNHLLKLVPKYADIACPSRYSKGGKQRLNARFKVWLPRFAGLLLNKLTDMSTNDPTNSYKLYSAKLFKNVTLVSTISFSVTLEIMAKAHLLGLRIVEIPTVWRDRQYGKTNFKLIPSLLGYFPWFCLALLRNRLFQLPSSWIRSLLTG